MKERENSIRSNTILTSAMTLSLLSHSKKHTANQTASSAAATTITKTKKQSVYWERQRLEKWSHHHPCCCYTEQRKTLDTHNNLSSHIFEYQFETPSVKLEPFWFVDQYPDFILRLSLFNFSIFNFTVSHDKSITLWPLFHLCFCLCFLQYYTPFSSGSLIRFT